MASARTSLAAPARCLGQPSGLEVDPFTMIFVDDVLVIVKTSNKPLEHLSVIFQRFRDANLTLKGRTCELIKSLMNLLGHIISAEGIRMTPDKNQKHY